MSDQMTLPLCDADQRTIAPAELIAGDALTALRSIASESVRLVISSPPYNVGKIYEKDAKLTLAEYLAWQKTVLTELVRTMHPGGSICWQTGTYVDRGELVPLDIAFYGIMKDLGLKLRNRIIWRFNFGLNSDKRFSGRYETVLWMTKGDDYYFNLDPVRIPQLYPGKRHPVARKEKAGLPSGNPLGKNPSDYWEFSAEKDFRDNPVWDIPNVKNNHPEKSQHPCQYPIELAERCVLALSKEGETILDPFVGTGTTVLAARKHSRKSIGIDKEEEYIAIANQRLEMLDSGSLPMRPIGKPVLRPQASVRVARVPEEWK